MKEQKLSTSDIWSISSRAFHTPLYRKKYTRTLEKLISCPQKTVAILDTACGIGFPSLDLYKSGFSNLSCSDADSNALKLLKQNFKNPIRFFQSNWEELYEKDVNRYDILLNVDNSLVYMDGWNKDCLAKGSESIFARILLVLKSFHQCLKPGGKLIVALTKMNSKRRKKDRIVFPEMSYNGQKVKVIWEAFFDWNSRIKTWVIHTILGTQEYQLAIKSYLITSDELICLLRQAGFTDIGNVCVSSLRDNLFVAHKPSHLI